MPISDKRSPRSPRLKLGGLLLFLGLSAALPGQTVSTSGLSWTGYQLRPELQAPLNCAESWAAPPNQSVRLATDQPFRLRIEVEADDARGQMLALQFRESEGAWRPLGLADFPYPKFSTPPISLIATRFAATDAETEDLLPFSTREHEEGLALSGQTSTPLFHLQNSSIEWEWPLVIRRFADGPTFIEDGTVFALRVVDGSGHPLPGLEPLQIETFTKPAQLGGTFIETPGRIGPYQTADGTLYFLMEPTETDNRFMIVSSPDGGSTWSEVDGANRPAVGDLEGVGSVFHEGVIHIIHQTSEAVFHHAFATRDAKASPNRWRIDSALVAEPSEPPTQSAALSIRADGQLAAVYGSAQGAWLQLGTTTGEWLSAPVPLQSDSVRELSGLQIATDRSGASLIAFSAAEGTAWLRVLSADGQLSEPLLISDSVGVSESENGPILPIVLDPTSGAHLIYRKADGSLWERRLVEASAEARLSFPRPVHPGPVVSGAVDSDQVGADAIADNGTIHLLFIDEESRDIFHTRRNGPDQPWEPATPLIRGIDAAWVRGDVVIDPAGRRGYGFIYDAGSQGGAGMNRFGFIPFD